MEFLIQRGSNLALDIVIVIVVVVACLSIAQSADAQVIYDVDFSSPPHTVGQEVTVVPIDAPTPRAAPTRVHFGSPEVMAGLGPLDQQPLVFQGGEQVFPDGTHYEQIEFYVDVFDAPVYRASFDLNVDYLDTTQSSGPLDALRILFDANQSRDINLDANGLRVRPLGGGSALVPFTFDSRIGLDMWLDFTANSWLIMMNGQTIFDGQIGLNDGDLRSIRFNLSDVDGDGSARVALDNFRLVAIPEPGTGILVMVGLYLMSGPQRRRTH